MPCFQGYFNSRPHTEVDRSKFRHILFWQCISTHDLTQRSTPRKIRSFCICGNFNSRPHTEVDCSGFPRQLLIRISTHDLTQRSTELGCLCALVRRISTHDLTQRSTAKPYNSFIESCPIISHFHQNNTSISDSKPFKSHTHPQAMIESGAKPRQFYARFIFALQNQWFRHI